MKDILTQIEMIGHEKCGLCGKPIDFDNLKILRVKFVGYPFIWWETKEIPLCEDCSESFHKWRKKRKEHVWR
jgi:predicted nucleic acid-binding Zn ribbon protein